jgi:hypothetical protein
LYAQFILPPSSSNPFPHHLTSRGLSVGIMHFSLFLSASIFAAAAIAAPTVPVALKPRYTFPNDTTTVSPQPPITTSTPQPPITCPGPPVVVPQPPVVPVPVPVPVPLPSPIPAPVPAGQWTITAFTRSCDAGDTVCSYSFGIDTHAGPVTPCAYQITGTPASRADYNGVRCGVYWVSSGWSGFFGPGNGFQTLSVKDTKSLIFPAYADAELINGVAVTPDKSYPTYAI